MRGKRKLDLHLVAGAAVVALIFSGVYRVSGRKTRFLRQPAEKRVTLRLDTPRKNPSRRTRYIIPVKSHSDRSSRRKRNTRFIAKRENAFSGRTTKKKETRWVRPDDTPDPTSKPVKGDLNAGKGQQKKGKAADLPEQNDGKKTSGDDLASYRGSLTQAQRDLIKKSKSLFQELPNYKNLNTDLLINFSNRGTLSLGTEAYKYADYFHDMVRKISKKWYRFFPKFQHFYGLLKEGNVLVEFELDLDGKVTSVRMVKSYGQPTVEKSCLLAIQGQNFGPIPERFRERGKMKIPFLFVYKRPKKTYRMFR